MERINSNNVPRFSNVVELIDNTVFLHGEKPAYTCMGCTLSFDRLNQMSDCFASYLLNELKLEPGDRIAVQLPNILQFPVVFYGAIKAGIIVVNANPLFRPREIEHQLIDCGAKVLVVLANVAHNVAQIIEKTAVKHVIVTEIADMHPLPDRWVINFFARYIKPGTKPCSFKNTLFFRDIFNLPFRPYNKAKPNPGDVLILQYTGGTTGVSKGAMLTHDNITSNVWQLISHIPEAFADGVENYLACLPLYHIYALNLHALSAFSIGGHNILIPNPRDLAFTVKTMKQHPVHVFVGINTLFKALGNYPPIKTVDFSSLRVTCAGGMSLTADAAALWQKTTGCTVLEGYGLTETSPVVCGNQSINNIQGSVGKPCPETELKLIDDNGDTVSGKGELCVRGPQVMKGYWQSDAETREVLSEDGWLKTGDIAEVYASGHVKIVDRKKDVILVSGFNVYPNEIEEVVHQLPDVLDVAAIGIEDDRCGEVVKLFVVSKSDDLTVEKIEKHCRAQLTGYKVPKQIVIKESLPKSTIGKVLRRKLRDI